VSALLAGSTLEASVAAAPVAGEREQAGNPSVVTRRSATGNLDITDSALATSADVAVIEADEPLITVADARQFVAAVVGVGVALLTVVDALRWGLRTEA
jgi:hypothetical protein